MVRLFSYGTLQQVNVQLDTFGRRLLGQRDTLVGYFVSDVKIRDPDVIKSSGKDVHPILKYTGLPSDMVEGTIFEITEQELRDADEYEVDEYIRVYEKFESDTCAWVYVCAQTNQLKNK